MDAERGPGVNTNTDQRFMRAALHAARQAHGRGEVPVGAVVVMHGEIAGAGCNQPISTHDPTAHAEIVAIRDAAQRTGNYRLTGAMVHARIARLVFGAPEPKAGAIESTQRAHEHPALNHHLEVTGHVLEEECRAVMQAFFRERRE
jgi:tRNA(adenine34) deaminase